MRSQFKNYSYIKNKIIYDEYGDRVEIPKKMKDIRIWISDRNILQLDQNTVEGLKWTHSGITQDKRVQKNDLIDNKRVIYVQKVFNLFYVYLQEVEGQDDQNGFKQFKL